MDGVIIVLRLESWTFLLNEILRTLVVYGELSPKHHPFLP